MLLRAVMDRANRRAERRDQFYREGVGPLGSLTSFGSITQDQAVKIIAIQACVSLLADTVSTLPIDSFDRQGENRVPLPQPDFLRVPDPSDPSVTTVDHVSQLMWSLCLDGNSFTLVLPSIYEPAELHVINPQRTTIRVRGRYQLQMDGGGTEEVGPDQLIHIPRSRRPGDLRGMSPVEEAGATFAMKRAADRFAANVFNQGIFLSGQMLLPGPVDKAVLEQLRDEITKQYAGAANGGKPGIFANGARWDVPRLNLQEMQVVELHRYAKLEAAGLYRIPPYLIGVVESGAMARASVEAQGSDLVTYTLRSYLERIEAAYDRLLPGPTTYLRFNIGGLLRGDFLTRMQGYQIGLASKFMKIDEVRALEDWPLFGEENGGGFLETPNNNQPGQALPPAATRGMPAPLLSLVATGGR